MLVQKQLKFRHVLYTFKLKYKIKLFLFYTSLKMLVQKQLKFRHVLYTFKLKCKIRLLTFNFKAKENFNTTTTFKKHHINFSSCFEYF